MRPASFILRILVLMLAAACSFSAGCSTPAALQQETGSVQVASIPSGAEIYFDHEYQGTTPAMVAGIPAGNHTIEVRREGYQTWSALVTVRAGSTVPVTASLAAFPAAVVITTVTTTKTPAEVRPGYPEITIDGYWSYIPGVNNTASNPVPVLVHATGINTGDGGAREVTASARIYYQGREICWKTIRLGSLGAGGHATTETTIFCPLPSGRNDGELEIRFDNLIVRP